MSDAREAGAGDPGADYWSVVEHMLDGFYRCTVSGEVVRCSPKAVQLMGYGSAEEMIGKVSMAEMWVYPEERDLLLAELREHGEARGFEATLKRKDGSHVRVELTVLPLVGEDGELLGTDGMVRDVSKRSRSEQQFRSLIRNSPGAMFHFVGGDERRYTFMSEAIEEITGYPPEHFTSQQNPLVAIIHADDAQTAEALRDLDLEVGRHYAFEFRILTPAGETRWVELRGTAALDRLSELPTVDGVIVDTTEAHRLADELAARERQVQSLIRNVPGAIYRFAEQDDGVWRFDLMSPAIEKMTGYPPEHFVSAADPFAEILYPEDREVVSQAVSRAIETDGDFDFEHRVMHRDGGLRWIRVQGSMTRNPDTGRRHVDGVQLDVTDFHEAEEEIRQARYAAEQANRAKSTFLANMSHELRTPLNAIIGYSEMMMEEAEDLEEDVFSEDLQKVHTAGTHLLALINDVLDLSKIEAGRSELFLEDFSLAELVNSVTATAEPLMAKNANQFAVEPVPKLTLRQDLTKFRQSLLNLLSNAAKFTHEGTVTLSARTETVDDVEWVELVVTDTGIGVPPEKHDKLFDEFSQADASTTRQYGGTGLGLAISRRFCRMMGGDITLKSAEGEGSAFTIRVPVRSAEQAPATAELERERITPESMLPLDPERTVLVIDDDPEACEIISRHLTRSGFEAVAAHTGAEGLRLAQEINPCAITLDVMMPEMDGWTVLSALKADPALKETPVVMVSMVDDKSTGYTLGATSYLTKPVNRDALLEAINAHGTPRGRVLVVEDDADTRAMLRRVLEQAGMEVVEAANGSEGLDAVDSSAPDMVLLDLMMPVMNGFEFVLELRGRPEQRELPVVVITSKDLSAEERNLLSGRVQHVLEKGAYGREQLLGLVRAALAEAGVQHSMLDAQRAGE